MIASNSIAQPRDMHAGLEGRCKKLHVRPVDDQHQAPKHALGW
jgi:hypothetical protein